jgi:cytoskeletal protein RodZ
VWTKGRDISREESANIRFGQQLLPSRVNQMVLRISRGLFRLWLVLSSFWVAAVAAHTWEAIPTTLEPTSSSVADTDSGRSRKDAELPSGSATLPSHSASRRDDDWSDVSKPLLSDAEVGVSAAIPAASLRDTMLDAAQIAFFPPIMVLAIGSALGWAFKGFR